MTPMSDVMVLLLTFFMLTATFVKEEPIQVQVPGSVADIKIPENNKLTIFVNQQGKVYFTMDNEGLLQELLEQMQEEKHLLGLTPAEKAAFCFAPTFGMPLNQTKAWLDAPVDKRNSILQKNADAGIPCDTINDELAIWVKAARISADNAGRDMKIAIKADQNTPYAVIKKVMDSLRRIHENRYNLITALKGSADE